MVHCGDADGYLGGIAHNYPDIVKPCLQTIGPDPSSHRIVGLYMMTVNGQLMFIADATINIYPDARTLAEKTLIGSAYLLENSQARAQDLRKAVTSPKGTTEAGLNVLMKKDAFFNLTSRAIQKAQKRGRELGKS